MRFNRLTILLLMVACKATTPTSSVSYSEDLSVHRPEIEVKGSEEEKGQVGETREPYTALNDHLKTELDSISRIAYEQNKAGKYIDGYVIQVYLGSSREQANQARAEMYEFFPQLNAKISYRQPNFRVKAGRFTNRLRANRIHQQVKEEFPRAILLPERFLQKYE